MKPPPEVSPADRLAGCLLGTAVGDAVGLPRENLSARRAGRLFGPVAGHRLIPTPVGWRGMCSDDCEHAALVALALLEEPRDPARFAAALARRVRWWLAGLPAGLGRATLKSGVKLWCGVSPDRSGASSAGNGPVMRAATLGAFFGLAAAAGGGERGGWDDRRRAFADASSRLTHTDPRAAAGARAVAAAAAVAVRGETDPAAPLAAATNDAAEPELAAALAEVAVVLDAGGGAADLAARLGWPAGGPTGFVVHTVPAALWAWLAGDAGDVRGATTRAAGLGGDADSTAAVAAALAGCAGGAAAVPADWLAGLWEWPRGEPWLRRCAAALAGVAAAGAADPAAVRALRVPPGAVPARNAAFLAVVLAHAARRALPPY